MSESEAASPNMVGGALKKHWKWFLGGGVILFLVVILFLRKPGSVSAALPDAPAPGNSSGSSAGFDAVASALNASAAANAKGQSSLMDMLKKISDGLASRQPTNPTPPAPAPTAPPTSIPAERIGINPVKPPTWSPPVPNPVTPPVVVKPSPVQTMPYDPSKDFARVFDPIKNGGKGGLSDLPAPAERKNQTPTPLPLTPAPPGTKDISLEESRAQFTKIGLPIPAWLR